MWHSQLALYNYNCTLYSAKHAHSYTILILWAMKYRILTDTIYVTIIDEMGLSTLSTMRPIIVRDRKTSKYA